LIPGRKLLPIVLISGLKDDFPTPRVLIVGQRLLKLAVSHHHRPLMGRVTRQMPEMIERRAHHQLQ